ncbi:MAG TPA: hypothetical protein VNT51_13925 [Miltoncostaeaceae bacterium]|nr:hypothetical protein [Miltoncostaeaceae bacterium]
MVTRLPATLARDGGWGSATIGLPPGRWRDLLTGGDAVEGLVPVSELLDRLPVALLVREDA